MSLIIANWKMQLSTAQAERLARAYGQLKSSHRLVVCPSLIHVPAVAAIVRRHGIQVGAQNCAPAQRGAYTGEVSVADLRAAGCSYVLIGHSERRYVLHDTELMIGQKITAALAARVEPIICIGEQKRGKSIGGAILERQLATISTAWGTSRRAPIITYEPLWAISTSGAGGAVDPQVVEKIGLWISDWWQRRHRTKPTLVYGGSITATNAADYLQSPLFKGILVGGSSLRLPQWRHIIKSK